MAITNVLLFGATQGCGLETLLHLLKSDKPYTATVMARSPDAFQKTLEERDAGLAASLKLSNRLNVLRGDALNCDDVSCAFTSAQKRFGDIDAVLFGIGGRLVFSRNPFAQPALSPSSVCERSIRILTDALIALKQPEQPRLVVISSNGLAKQGYSLLPYLMRPLYAFLLHAPHDDKERMESHLHALAGWPRDDFNPLHREQLEIPPKIKHLAIVRPALLVNGVAIGHVRAEEMLRHGYTIRRSDVGLFIYNSLLGGPQDRGQYVGKAVTVAY
ncbi:uncharacterized protein UMAG_05814 [Mycosarcoma maydis]|uniref:NAD(P)-binding domain-containing protein n=1 Tax=Mycosarcoma maydis TaxID=5270 RepID=A0A0D1DQ48_MYCMD|nr:uncharacterized protein UMAG_05814 [Ustilago maydis 521]KIS66071.1 hypothetical protein UMAG_05814 [Ustilago maydis 521]|eukprot:XP_011392185.1 hypothetical protein UMAG_05814 [Ustilago maydis 521]